jgi:hypothetical protein
MARNEITYNRTGIRNVVKSIVGRNFSGIDAVLDNLTNMAIELFGNTVSAVYDEFVYTHTITSGEVSAKTDEYNLPARTKMILDAYYIDVSGSDDVYYPIDIRSPIEFNEAGKYSPSVQYGRPSFNYATDTVKFGSPYGGGAASRADFSGIPNMGYRVNNAFHVYPRPGTSQQDNKIRLMLGMFPKELTDDSHSNSITENYPQALASYTSALFWGLHMNDAGRAAQFLTTAQLLLASFAKQDEINKLVNITIKLP